MNNLEAFILTLVKNGGPEASEYKALNQWFQQIGTLVRDKKIDKPDAKKMQAIFGEALSEHTLQGLIINNSHGYAGNFEVIDKIYTHWVSDKKHLRKWDKFSHWQDAASAVRNRKSYFKKQLYLLDNSSIEHPSVLNIGSGSSRDLYEYQQENPATRIHFECVDMDKNAINFSKNLLKNSGCNVNFHHKNAFRFRSKKQFDLVWSAGLFDYLSEKEFVFLMKLLINRVTENGELIIGNFSTQNASKDCMEFLEWNLHHRDERELTRLAVLSDCHTITIDQEERGVNLFMKTKNTRNRTEIVTNL